MRHTLSQNNYFVLLSGVHVVSSWPIRVLQMAHCHGGISCANDRGEQGELGHERTGTPDLIPLVLGQSREWLTFSAVLVCPSVMFF